MSYYRDQIIEEQCEAEAEEQFEQACFCPDCDTQFPCNCLQIEMEEMKR